MENYQYKLKLLNWLKYLQSKGLDNDELNYLIFKNTFDSKKLNSLLKDNFFIKSFNAPITNKSENIISLNCNFLQIYKIPFFIDDIACSEIIDVINNSNLVRTGKNENFNEYTDKKCVFKNQNIIKELNNKMTDLIGIKNCMPTLGMKYFKNDYKNRHFDNPWKYINGKLELGIKALRDQSLTTWTFMIYLNDVKDGGETFFPKIDLKIVPQTGLALVWNNLFVDGSINPYSEHESLKVNGKEKYIITKWFKSPIFN